MNRTLIALGLGFLGATAAAALPAPPFTILELPPLPASPPPFSPTPTAAFGLSNRVVGNGSFESAYVVGYSGTQAVRWIVTCPPAVSAPLALGILPGASWSSGYGVNDVGHVVGDSGLQSFYWPSSNGGMGALPYGYFGAHAINNADGVAANCTVAVNGQGWLHPWVAIGWSPNSQTPPPSSTLYCTGGLTGPYLGLQTSGAYAINAGGVIAGAGEVKPAGNVVEASLAMAWPGCGPLTLSGGEPGDLGQATAYGINDHLDLVGTSYGWAFVSRGCGPPTSLGVSGSAFDINNLDTIVGQMTGQHAFRYPPVLDLTYLIPGWALATANAVNDNNWIIGTGIEGGTAPGPDGGPQGIQRGYVLIPNPCQPPPPP